MKNIFITEGSRARRFAAVKKLKTPLQSDGSCLWVPEDERQLESMFAYENGVYRPEGYGFDSANVNVIDGNFGNLDADTNMPYIPTDLDGYGQVKVNVPESQYGTYSDVCDIETLVPDPNYPYHISYGCRAYDWYRSKDYNHRTGEWSSDYQTGGDAQISIFIDSPIPFFIKKYSVPVYYDYASTWGGEEERHNDTYSLFALMPYMYRSKGLKIASKNYRIRMRVRGLCDWGAMEDNYKQSYVLEKDEVITMPSNSSNHSKWISGNYSGNYLLFYDEETQETDWSGVSISYNDGTVIEESMQYCPYDINNQTRPTTYHPYYKYFLQNFVEVGFNLFKWPNDYPLVYGAPGMYERHETSDYTRNKETHYSRWDQKCNTTFLTGNNPIFTGTYDEYRTYIEQNFG